MKLNFIRYREKIMKQSTITLFLLFSAVLLLTVRAAEAACTASNQTFAMPTTLVVPRDLPVGSRIGSEVITPSYTLVTGTCTTGTDVGNGQVTGLKVLQSYVTHFDGRHIYAVPGLPGIGYAFGIEDTFACRGAVIFVGRNDGTDWGGVNTQKVCGSNGIWSVPMTGAFHLVFYKTAEVTASGSVASFSPGTFIVNTQGSWMIPEAVLTVTGLTAKTATCSVTNSTINVKLDAAKSSNLSDVGSTTGSTPFNISLKNCDAGLNLSLSLNAGSAGSSDPTKGLLTADSTSDATGLALQLMYNNAPVSLGTRFSVQGLPTVSGGNYDIPLVVRYFKTDKKITSGKINASATFTMVYN
jgi:type 1 fimbria pilin